MGKFSGVLIASDYDNTMVYTEGALKSGGPLPSVSRENREAGRVEAQADMLRRLLQKFSILEVSQIMGIPQSEIERLTKI